jgi:uncharacterized protein YjbI with pentapeptide repeats
MSGIKKYDKLQHIETNPRNIRIDFDEFKKIEIKAKEINNCEITGTYRNTSGIFHGNVVMSNLVGFNAENADLENIDWKDSNFRDCRFLDTSFDISAVINCQFSSCKFQRCHFSEAAITGSTFYEAIFLDCDLRNIVMENCRFFNCSFLKCRTTNKVFEHCLMFDSKFENTDIQLQTITENFGIEASQLKHSDIRSAALDENFEILYENDLRSLISKSDQLHDFYKFKIEYFLNPEITIVGSNLFDKIFKIKEWVPLCKAQATFINMFRSFHDFFLILFEQNKALLLVIYRLKTLTIPMLNEFAK